MADERKAKIKIEDLPRPEEELTPEQAEKLTGGAFSTETTEMGGVKKTDPTKDTTLYVTWNPLTESKDEVKD